MATEAQIVAVAKKLKRIVVIFDNSVTIHELVKKIKAGLVSGELTDDNIQTLASAIWSKPHWPIVRVYSHLQPVPTCSNFKLHRYR